MSTADELRKIVTVGRPLVVQALELSEEFAAVREAAREKGIDWAQVKGLLKAQIQDEADGGGRVAKIIEKAEFASAYADMLGMNSNVNEENNSRKRAAG